MASTEVREFRPELFPRRGEWTAWGLALIVSAGAFSISYFGGLVASWVWLFTTFLLFSAISISLGNWVDRQTIIRIDPGGVAFQNGLRKMQMNWNTIVGVRVSPAHWGKRVHVLGETGRFEFKTLGAMQFRGHVQARTGFAAGEEILNEILRSAALTSQTVEGQAHYYSRS
jgi:hypothetical protein